MASFAVKPALKGDPSSAFVPPIIGQPVVPSGAPPVPAVTEPAAAPAVAGGVTDPQQAAQLFAQYGVDPAHPAGVDPAHPVDPAQLIAYQAEMHKQLVQIKALPIAVELTVLAQSKDLSADQSRDFMNALDRIDDPDVRKQVKASFEQMNNQSLETYISGADFHGKRDQKVASDLISDKRDAGWDELGKLSAQDRAKAEAQANDWAIQILSSTTAHDHSDDNVRKIFRVLGPRTPGEIELIRAAIRRQTHGESSLYMTLDDGTHKEDEDEAVQEMSGDPVANALAGIHNADGDADRIKEVLLALKPDQIEKLRHFDCGMDGIFAAGVKDPAAITEIIALVRGDKVQADAARLGDMLKPKAEGVDPLSKEGQDIYDKRKPANVLKEFEAMSGDEVQAAAKAWNAANPDRTFEQMIKDRWGDDSDPTEYHRLLAMVNGDKGLDRSLRLEEGLRTKDQDEIEGALAHQTVDPKALESKDDKVKKAAEATQKENDSFERNNVEADKAAQEFWPSDPGETITGESTKQQLEDYYAADKAKDIGSTMGEKMLGGKAADEVHAERQREHNEDNLKNSVGAMDLLEQGKLSEATEIYRAKDKKSTAQLVDGIKSNDELKKAEDDYQAKYKKEMLPVTDKSRDDMNANELMIDNVRVYGVKAERDAQTEYLLQKEQYEVQSSDALENEEATEAGGGTQKWQREELAAERDMLKDPKGRATLDPRAVSAGGFTITEHDKNEESREDIEKQLPVARADHKTGLDDGLKDGVTKAEFNAQDKGMTAANAAQETAKVKLGEHLAHLFSTLMKIASILVMQPELILLIDVASGLIEMGIKASVEGEAYDWHEDAKMLAVTAVADVALMGLTKLGKLKGAASLAEKEALSVGEKAATEVGHAATAEAKTEVIHEGAEVAAAESKELTAGVKVAGKGEDVATQEAGAIADKVEQKAGDVAEGKGLTEGESVAAQEGEKVAKQEGEQVAKQAGEDAGEEAAKELTPEELAKKIEAHYALAGGFAKNAISSVGGGLVQGQSPTDILKSFVKGGILLVLPAELAKRAEEAIGDATKAAKILKELAGTGAEFTTNLVVGGDVDADNLLNAATAAAGSKVQKHLYAPHGGAAHDDHAPDGAEGHDPAGESAHVTAPEVAATPAAAREIAATPAAAPETTPAAAPAVTPAAAPEATPAPAPEVAAAPAPAPEASPAAIEKVAQSPEIAKVVAAEPEIAPVIGAQPESPVVQAVAENAPVADVAPETPQTAADHGPVASEGLENRFEHAVFEEGGTSNDRTQAEVHEYAKLAETSADFEFVLAEAKAQNVELSPERRAILERAAAGGDPAEAHAALEALDAVDVARAAPADGAAPPSGPAGDHAALVELAVNGRAEDMATIREWAAELDAADPSAHRDALRELKVDTRASGNLSPEDGLTMREWGHEAELDKMSFVDSMHYEGMDRAEVQRIFDKAALNDASASYKPGDALHQASDGTDLAVPGSGTKDALTQAEIKQLIEMHAARFDHMHAEYTTGSGRELDASPMRKAVNTSTAQEYRQGFRTDAASNQMPMDKMGGDVGLKASTEGQTAERGSATLGLDYEHASNMFYDPTTKTWTPMVTAVNGGLPVVDFPQTQQIHDSVQVPLGQDAKALFEQHGSNLKTSGQYVPELLQSTTAADGSTQFPHLSMRNKETKIDPRTGWGMSATERAIDPNTGAPYPVVPNQELNLPSYVPAPGLNVDLIPSQAAMAAAAPVAPVATPAAPVAPVTPEVTAAIANPPEAAPVVAAQPDVAPQIAAAPAPESPVAKVADEPAAASPTVEPAQSPEDASTANIPGSTSLDDAEKKSIAASVGRPVDDLSDLDKPAPPIEELDAQRDSG